MGQTKRDIQALLAGAGIRPLKRYGQHFLIDGNLMRKLVSAAEIQAGDVVLEVGPGTGPLTEELLQSAGHVVAVEIDKGLHAICRDRFGTCDRFTLIHRDILKRKSAVAAEVLDTLREKQKGLNGRIMLVANLPYQVATPLLIDLLLGDTLISPLCFTVQAEVADRLLAEPGTKIYGPISILTQAMADVKKIARVPPEAFWPVPKVDSAMLRLDVQQHDALPTPVRQRLAELVHGCFNHRRKTMRSNLRTLLDVATFQELETNPPSSEWNLSDRPEQITVPQWIALARKLTTP